MLYLIGLGLNPPTSLTQEALEALRHCDVLFLDSYTGYVTKHELEQLEREAKKKIQPVARGSVESGAILQYAVKNNAGLLVPGDPLASTTHADLLLMAKEKKIRYSVAHNASILTAVGESGLQICKFGRSVTIARWQKNFEPTSFARAISENQERGLHTILLADTHESMPLDEALKILDKACKAENIELPDNLVVCSRLGKQDATIAYVPLAEAAKLAAPIPFCLIVPGRLHGKEKEMLESFRQQR